MNVLKLSIIQNILIFFSVKVFDLKQILKNHDIENFDLYFVSNNNYSNLYRLFKNEKKSLIIFGYNLHLEMLEGRWAQL